MLHTIWLWLQGLFVLGRNDLDHESSAESGHGVAPDG